MKYYIQTLGCAMNHSDSERVAAILEKIGYNKTNKPEETDLYIFNSCSIRQKGEDRVYGQFKKFREWKKLNPRLLIGITGCMVRKTSSRNSEKEDKDKLLSRLDNLDFVFKITDTQKLGDVLMEAEATLSIQDTSPLGSNTLASKACEKGEAQTDLPDEGGDAIPLGSNAYLRITPKYNNLLTAYVPIQTGCDKYCTYCIVPYARGRETSRPMQDIIEECTKLVENGCKEITLGGQNVNAYGKSVQDIQSGQFNKDQNQDPFITLLTELDKLKSNGLHKLNFTAPHPRHFSDEQIQAHVDLETLPNHIHLPVQAGDDTILDKMNRQYTTQEFKEIIRKFREKNPGCSVTTDIIVGFCGETEEQFDNTSKLFEEMQFDMAFLARYSERQGTTSQSAFEDDISREEKARRWHILNELLEKSSTKFNESFIGKTVEVLVEKYNEETGECEGKNRENIVVQFKGTPDLVGSIVNPKITKALTWLVKGEI